MVRIETGTPGRFLIYRPAVVVADRCEVSLPLGFGPRPASREVQLQNPDGSTTDSRSLRIAAAGAPSAAGGAGGGSEAPAEQPVGGGAPAGSAPADRGSIPVIRELRPATAPAGVPFALEVLGEGFEPSARVLVTVNVNAGSSRLPVYEPRPFTATVVAAGRIEIEIDRGFYGIPGGRDVVVENPGGERSQPAVLTIRAPEEAP